MCSRKREIEKGLFALDSEDIVSNPDHIKMSNIEILHSASPFLAAVEISGLVYAHSMNMSRCQILFWVDKGMKIIFRKKCYIILMFKQTLHTRH